MSETPEEKIYPKEKQFDYFKHKEEMLSKGVRKPYRLREHNELSPSQMLMINPKS